MARLLTISSWVARGHVGNSATTFPLMRLGFDVCAMPTVVLAHHPGHAPNPARVDMPDLLPMGTDILASPSPHPVDAVLVGYIAVSPQVAPIAGLVAEARALKPGIPALVDPICGDDGALYVDEAIVAEIGATLLPLADIVTPNVTELAALTGRQDIAAAPDWPVEKIAELARTVPVPAVVVTSVVTGEGRIGNLVVTAESVHCVDVPRIDGPKIHGTGDVMAGLILGKTLLGHALVDATAFATGAIHDLLAASASAGRDELALASAQECLLHPRTKAEITKV